MRVSAVRTRLQPIFFFFFFRFQYVTYFFLLSQPSSFTFFFFFFKISLVSPNCYFCFISFLFVSPTVSIRIFINEMMLSCYLSMLVILNLLNGFATFRMKTSDNVQG